MTIKTDIMEAVTIPNSFKLKIIAMADTAKSYFDQKTLIPISLAMTFVTLISAGVVSHVTMATKVERLEAQMLRVEEKYVDKEIFAIKFGQIQDDLAEIKALLKEKQ